MSTPTHPDSSKIPGGHFRISDGDRDLVTNVLTTAFAEGRITREEFDERAEQVLAAKTFNDLAPITADLMPATGMQQYASTVYSSPLPVRPEPGPDQLVVVDPSRVSDDSDSLFGIMGTARRNNPGWRMHRKTSVLVGLGDAIIDLTQGVMEDPHSEIEVMVGLGDLKVIVPAGVQVIDRVSNIMGESQVLGTRPPAEGGPTITITGVTFMGEVKVIGPDHKSFASILKKEAKKALKQKNG